MRKQLILVAVVAMLAALAAPSAAKPSRNLIVGIFDEQSTLGNPDWAFPQYDSLGVEALRVNLYWGGPTGVARTRRPAHAVDPADPAYDWAVYDAMVKRAKENSIKVVFSILWTPGWAGPAKNHAPRRMRDLRNFAYAAAKRYSGSFRPVTDGPPLPAVRHWIAWNEPNNPVFLKPQFTKIGRRKYRLASPGIYAKMCNSIWSGVHLTGLRGEKVACGATSPRGNNSGTLPRASLSPLPFLRGMKKAHARFDVYAHHPYYQHPNEPPNRPPAGVRGDHPRQHQRADQGADSPLRPQATLDHRVRLPDEPTRPALRRLVRKAGALSEDRIRRRPRQSAHRHDDLVPAEGRGADPQRLAVGLLYGLRPAEAKLARIQANAQIGRTTWRRAVS